MNLIYFYLLFWITCGACYEVTNKVDFEKNCDVQMQVSDSAIVEVFAYPQAGVLPETSSCQAKFVATPSSRKLRIYVHEFFLGPGACGHKMKIYDGDAFQKDPTWELSCNTPLTTYTSSSNFVILSFTKPSVDTSQLYKFNIKITTDQDEPTLLFEALKTPDEHKLKWPAYRILQHRKRRQTENKPSYTAPLTNSAGGSSGGGLTSGAIAGIAVGGVVGAVIIIAICIYALWKFLRQSEEKSRYGASEPPPVFATPEQPLSNCGIAPGSSRRSFRSHSHVAFSDVSKKSEKGSTSSDGISKSRSYKSYENPSFSNDGTSVASSNIKGENAKDVKSHNSTDQNNRSNQEEFSRDKKSRRSYRNDREEENINYPDVVDSARKSEKEKYHDNLSSKETRSRGDSVRKTDREGNKHKERSDSVKKNEKERDRDRIESRGRDKDRSKRHKSRDDYEDDSDDRGRIRYTHREYMKHEHGKYDNEHRSRSTGHRHKTESVHTDDSGATYPSSVSDRYYDRQNRPNDRYDDRRYRDDRYDDRKYRDDRYDDRKYRDDRYDDHRQRDNRHTSERSSSQRKGRTDSHRRHKDVDDLESEGMRSRRGGDQGKQRSNSTSRMRSSSNKQSSDNDRYRDSNRDQRGRHNNERESGLRRQDSSRSQGGRHRSKSSYR